ncbi:hypothetical protein LPTSP2_07290 [Leptospira ellinghausenii]|uniref:Uncharacterized protein n=1 Tax=Leptospira ellinghausenii TaxID=1917822 RepID=A0A2P2D9Z0_9LEPT|nr:hypothetical protein LPTSP2_07290 [Leptospira ellinghausenii]
MAKALFQDDIGIQDRNKYGNHQRDTDYDVKGKIQSRMNQFDLTFHFFPNFQNGKEILGENTNPLLIL